jgi:hypothetical protein
MGQRVVYDAVTQVLAMHNMELAAAMRTFVEQTTSDHKLRYKLPATGRMQRRGSQAQSAAVKASGSWDVAFPLEEFGDQLAWDRTAYGYMTVQDLDRHIDGITIRDTNTVRYEMLYSILNSTAATFVDPLWGSLTIERLANGDSVLYPPVLGSETEATANHYVESGYAATAISDTNDPYVTIINALESRFGAVQGGSNIVVFINDAQTPKTKALTSFVDVTDYAVTPGLQTAIPASMGPEVPGRIIGRHDSGAWVSEWRWIPANYMVGIHLEAPRPLMERVDPGYTGLGTGLQLVAESDMYPATQAHYEHRFGFGVGNRLNGYVLELGTGGSYSVPTAYQ